VETVLVNAFIEEVPDEETSITIPNVYETYLNNLAPGEKVIPMSLKNPMPFDQLC
jgi:hypothetical protein